MQGEVQQLNHQASMVVQAMGNRDLYLSGEPFERLLAGIPQALP